MGRDRNDRDCFPLRTVVPGNEPCRWCPVLGESLKDFLAARIFDGVELAGMQSGVARICFKVTKGFPHRLETLRERCTRLQGIQIGGCLIGENKVKGDPQSDSLSANLAKLPRERIFPAAD
jgi:hypothetical protein